MAKTAAIIPSRDERFLIPTVEDLFRNARGEFEVIVVLDSSKWPDNWAGVTAKYPNLHTIHNGKSLGMRASINRGVASAISRKAKFIMKSDAHCSFSEGFDEVLKAECEPNWVVIPRRGRLDAEKWVATDTHKPDIDYHYLSFPDDPNDFGGPGLNGKVWAERAVERKDILIDEEMSSQGSCWFMHAKYFNELELMDEANYGMFWNEMQEIGLKCWLSGGQMMVNKKAKYLHLHKGRKYGRGYKLPESELTKGATFTKKWLFNEAWDKQTLPFKSLIERFWPVPTWPEDWEELVYDVRGRGSISGDTSWQFKPSDFVEGSLSMPQLQIHSAYYGIGDSPEKCIVVTDRLRELVKNDSLDIVVNNDTLAPGQNPFRGKKKTLRVRYSINGGEPVAALRQEKEWLIIGGPRSRENNMDEPLTMPLMGETKRGRAEIISEPAKALTGFGKAVAELPAETKAYISSDITLPMSAAALNDYLIRKFHVSDRRLRAPMPVELRDFNRNDLAKLFAELGFAKGAEIGVAEGHYSKILCQSIPNLELLCVDPWTRYSDNPWAHSQEHQNFSKSETERKLKGYNAKLIQDYSMNAVRDVPENLLDFVYVDAHHGFDWAMSDLIEWGKRVRSGGIISGDDYYHFKRHWGGVVEAVNAYVGAHKVSLWFICDAPNSVDYFWVKP